MVTGDSSAVAVQTCLAVGVGTKVSESSEVACGWVCERIKGGGRAGNRMGNGASWMSVGLVHVSGTEVVRGAAHVDAYHADDCRGRDVHVGRRRVNVVFLYLRRCAVARFWIAECCTSAPSLALTTLSCLRTHFP